jgi:hypothetical protein
MHLAIIDLEWDCFVEKNALLTMTGESKSQASANAWLFTIIQLILPGHAPQGRQFLHQWTQGGWHGRVIGANRMTHDANIDCDHVLVFIWIELDDQVFRQVEEACLFDQVKDGSCILSWKLIKVQLESHSLTDKPA